MGTELFSALSLSKQILRYCDPGILEHELETDAF